MWAAGCVLYTMLSGYQPFYQHFVKDLIDAIIKGNYNFDEEVWTMVSEEAKELISYLLNKDPQMRPSPSIIMQFPWFHQDEQISEAESIDNAILIRQNLKKNRRKLTRIYNDEEFEILSSPVTQKQD